MFFSGAQVLRISSVKLSAAGGLSMISSPPSSRKDTLSPSASTRSSVRPSPCSRNGCGAAAGLRSTRMRLPTMVFAGSRSKLSSMLRIQ